MSENASVTKNGSVTQAYNRSTGTGSGRLNSVTSSSPSGVSIDSDQGSFQFFKNIFSQSGNDKASSFQQSSEHVAGTSSHASGANIRVVGTPEQFRDAQSKVADQQKSKYTAARSTTPDDRFSMSFSPAKELAKIPLALTKTFTKSISPDEVKVQFKPTGNLLLDTANFALFFEERLAAISVGSIAQKALLAVQAEAERIEMQFEQCASLPEDMLNKLVGKGAKANPSTQNSEKEYTLTKKQLQKAASENIEAVLKAERRDS